MNKQKQEVKQENSVSVRRPLCSWPHLWAWEPEQEGQRLQPCEYIHLWTRGLPALVLGPGSCDRKHPPLCSAPAAPWPNGLCLQPASQLTLLTASSLPQRMPSDSSNQCSSKHHPITQVISQQKGTVTAHVPILVQRDAVARRSRQLISAPLKPYPGVERSGGADKIKAEVGHRRGARAGEERWVWALKACPWWSGLAWLAAVDSSSWPGPGSPPPVAIATCILTATWGQVCAFRW